jgi:hypothetical protein
VRFEGDFQWIKYNRDNTVTVCFTPQREGLCEAVLELTFCDHKHKADFVIKRTLSGRAKQPTGGAGGQTKQPSGGRNKQPAGKQTKQPAGGQTKQPTGGQTKQPAGEQTKKPASGQIKKPASEQTKQPAGGQTKQTAGEQTKKPASEQIKQPAGEQTKQPAGGKTKQPARGQTKQPAGGQTKQPTGGQTEQPSGIQAAGGQRHLQIELPNAGSQPVDDQVDDYARIPADEELLDNDGTGISVSHPDGLDFGIVERLRRNGPFATPSFLLTIKHEDDYPAVAFVLGRTKTADGNDREWVITLPWFRQILIFIVFPALKQFSRVVLPTSSLARRAQCASYSVPNSRGCLKQHSSLFSITPKYRSGS